MTDIFQIDNINDMRFYQKGFIRIFKQAFAGAPYFENFQDKEVKTIMADLALSYGSYCAVLLKNNEVIGLVGGLPLSDENEIADLLHAKNAIEDPQRTFYLAELAVANDFRKKGLGTKLVKSLLKDIQKESDYDNIIVRTQSEGSNAINIFKNNGLKVVPNIIQSVETYVGKNGNRKKVLQKRLFLKKTL